MNRINPAKMEFEARKLIVENKNQDEIYDLLVVEVSHTFKKGDPALNSDELEMLDNIISDIIKYHPNYKLRQRIRNCKLIMDGKGSGKEYILYSLATHDQWIHSKSSIEKLLKPWNIQDKLHHSYLLWNPYDNTKLQKAQNGWWKYNTYEPPEWIGPDFYKKDLTFPSCNLPFIYDKFFKHLVDSHEESYNYILNWLAMALQPNKRNFCILTTIGQQGIGKGILGQIMEKLVGKENCSLTTQKAISGTFNKQLKNKIIIYINEVEVKTTHDENRLKGYIDETIEIEAKHMDSETIQNHGNLYVSTNNHDALRLTADDRRFSIVMLTKIKLIKVMTHEEINELFKLENIKKLGRYLMNREVSEKQMSSPLKTALTEEIREASLKVWESYLVDVIWQSYEGETIDLEVISGMLEEKFGSKVQVGPKGFKSVADVYPGKIEIIKKRVEHNQLNAKGKKKDIRKHFIKFLEEGDQSE